MHPLPGPSEQQHPSDDEIREYSFGFAETELIDQIEKHLVECGQCARTIADLVFAYMRAVRAQTLNDAQRYN